MRKGKKIYIVTDKKTCSSIVEHLKEKPGYGPFKNYYSMETGINKATLIKLYKKCRRSDTSFLILIIKALYYKLRKKNILVHQRVTIKGLNNIQTDGLLTVGIDYIGFSDRSDKTLLNIKGNLKVKGDFTIQRGSRWDIGTNATVTLGNNGYIHSFSLFVIMHQLEIGDDCAISWNCQFLDSDFHEISYPGKKDSSNPIKIGNKVWIGSNVSIYKGTQIPDGCVIAANSVVRGVFTEENALIAGNPARVIKSGVKWW